MAYLKSVTAQSSHDMLSSLKYMIGKFKAKAPHISENQGNEKEIASTISNADLSNVSRLFDSERKSSDAFEPSQSSLLDFAVSHQGSETDSDPRNILPKDAASSVMKDAASSVMKDKPSSKDSATKVLKDPVTKGDRKFSSKDGLVKKGDRFESLEQAKSHVSKVCEYSVIQKSTDQGKYIFLKCPLSGKPSITVDATTRQRERTSLKCECPFEVRLRQLSDSVYEVYSFNLEHNHDPLHEDEKLFLQCNRFIPEEVKKKCIELSKEGILEVRQIMYLIEKQFFPEMKVTWNVKDIQNLLQKESKRPLEAHEFISRLMHLKNSENWFVEVDLDPVSLRLKRVFWMSANGKNFCSRYSDIWEGDATYKTNRFGMPLVLFTGCDNNGITVLLGGALVCDESLESYVWVLNALKAAANVHPDVLMTDGDINFARAIEEVFPTTVHVLCRWHISQNILKHLSSAFGDKMNEFLEEFWRISSLESTEDFEDQWEGLRSAQTNAKVIDYLDYLFEKKKKWIFAYTHCYFLAGISSTQRQESVNFSVKRDIIENATLSHLLESFNRLEKKICAKIVKASFTTKVFETQTNDPIVSSASKYLTSYAANLAKEEVLRYGNYVINEKSRALNLIVFEVYHRDFPQKARIVEIKGFGLDDKTHLEANCSCRKDIWHGIVCRHILSALRRLNILDCPEKWYNQRWFKDEEQQIYQASKVVKQCALASSNNPSQLGKKEEITSVLMPVFRFLLMRSFDDEKSFEITKSSLFSAEISVKALQKRAEDTQETLGTSSSVIPLAQNPNRCKNKGREKKKRNKPSIEEAKSKKKKANQQEKKKVEKRRVQAIPK